LQCTSQQELCRVQRFGRSQLSLLNIPFAATNTTVLVLSSVTCQYGVFAAERFQAKREGSLWQISKWGMREWFALTFLMGAFFIAGQVYEYAMSW
jgi:cytochrome c oxidase subunit III